MDAQRKADILVDYGLKAACRQFLMSVIANTPVIASGMTLGFSAVALPYMLIPNEVLYVDKYQASWIASLGTMSTPLGCLVNGPIIDRFGRKWGILFVNFPSLLGWICMAVNPSLYQIYLGRLLTGFSVGLSSTPATIYSAEIATPSLRGYLTSATSVAISLGVAIVYILGLFFKDNWQAVACVCCSVPITSTILALIVLPESPTWLMSRGKREKALSSLKILRKAQNEDAVRDEFNELIERSRLMTQGRNKLVSSVKKFGKPQAYKPLIIMNLFFAFQQLSGIFVVMFYAVDVVVEMGITADPFLITVIIGIMRLIVTFVSAWLSKALGRRPTALISGLGMAVSLFTLATILTVQTPESVEMTSAPALNASLANATHLSNSTDFQMTSHWSSVISIIAILAFIATSTIGFLTLPWAMSGEVFPTEVRGIAGGVTSSVAYFLSFLTLKFYPFMLDVLSKHGVFYFYGSASLLGVAFVYCFLPETEGKTLTQIEEYFAVKKTKQKDADDLPLNGIPAVL